MDDIFKETTKPVKYDGIDVFFAVLAVVLVGCAIPIIVLAWRAAF